MAEKISQYTADQASNPIKGTDLLDASNWDGVSAFDVSKKITVTEFLTLVPTYFSAASGTTQSGLAITVTDTINYGSNLLYIDKTNEGVGFGLVPDTDTTLQSQSADSTVNTYSFKAGNVTNNFLAITGNGKWLYRTKEILDYNVGNDRLIMGVGVAQFNITPTTKVTITPALHVTTINSIGGGTIVQLVLGSNAATLKGGNNTSSGTNVHINTDLTITAANNNLFKVSNNNVEALAVDKDAYLILRANDSAIADSVLDNSQMSYYIDESGNTMVVKVKYAAGTVKTGTIALA